MSKELAKNVSMTEIDVLEKKFELEQRVAKAMVTSNILPANFRNIGDVIILNEMSRNLDIPAIQLAQQLYIVKGKVGFSGQFAIALLNKAVELGKIEKWNYEIREDGAIRVTGKRDNDILEGTWIDKELVQRNGWNNNRQWTTNFDLMARYRSATWFIRLYFPELLMGMYEAEELQDSPAKKEKTPAQKENNEVDVFDVEVENIEEQGEKIE